MENYEVNGRTFPVATYADLTAQEREALDVFERAEREGPSVYLAAVALLCSALGEDWPKSIDMGQYSRNTFKRAIKVLRVAQGDAAARADSFEGAVQFIRRAWLHKEVTM